MGSDDDWTDWKAIFPNNGRKRKSERDTKRKVKLKPEPGCFFDEDGNVLDRSEPSIPRVRLLDRDERREARENKLLAEYEKWCVENGRHDLLAALENDHFGAFEKWLQRRGER